MNIVDFARTETIRLKNSACRPELCGRRSQRRSPQRNTVGDLPAAEQFNTCQSSCRWTGDLCHRRIHHRPSRSPPTTAHCRSHNVDPQRSEAVIPQNPYGHNGVSLLLNGLLYWITNNVPPPADGCAVFFFQLTKTKTKRKNNKKV